MGCDAMKKLVGLAFPWMRGWNESYAINAKEFAVPATTRPVRLWYLSMALLLGTMLVVLAAPVMGQAVNATLLGTVADTSGGVVAGATLATIPVHEPLVPPMPGTLGWIVALGVPMGVAFVALTV